MGVSHGYQLVISQQQIGIALGEDTDLRIGAGKTRGMGFGPGLVSGLGLVSTVRLISGSGLVHGSRLISSWVLYVGRAIVWRLVKIFGGGHGQVLTSTYGTRFYSVKY
jgi:hypothetical protein